jgi:hypothetical protein
LRIRHGRGGRFARLHCRCPFAVASTIGLWRHPIE